MTISRVDTKSLETAAGADPAVKAQVFAFVELLLLSIWLGSMFFFSFMVPPSAFGVLPSRHLAGQLVASTLGKVELIGLIIGALVVLVQLATWKLRGTSLARLGLALAMMAAMAVSRLWVSSTLMDLRASMGGIIDDVPATDPLRVQFNSLHQYSVALMMTAMVSGLVLLFLTVRSWVRR
ncbi:MAG TPA: DUF4149 domain-containing protein [Blastocatellia bacterium]|jgi:flagellar biosynthesis protein FliQ|nr:DUF4149 domain-containing protein [Blastocatellia bacterium]